MPKLRLMCTSLFAAAAVLHYCAADMQFQKGYIPIFPMKQNGDIDTFKLKESLEPSNDVAKTSVSIATNVADNYGKMLEIVGKNIGKGLKFLPVVGQIAGVMFDLISIFGDPPNPNVFSELTKYVDEKVKLETQETKIADIGTEVSIVLDRFENSAIKDQESNMYAVKDSLYKIVSLLMKEQYHLREYPAAAVPRLFAMAPIAAIVSKYLQENNVEEDISCLYAAAIKQYFHPFLYDRLRRMQEIRGDQQNYRARGTSNKWHAAFNAGLMTPFLFDGVQEHDGMIKGCRPLKDDDKPGKWDTIIIKDTKDSTATALFCTYEGAENYLKYVRNIIEKKFSDLYKVVAETCLKPKQPSGMGWANWLIGGVYAMADHCDPYPVGSSPCDPYVDVSFNDKTFSTPVVQNKDYFTEFNELFHSTKIKNDTQYTIRFMDQDWGNPDDKIVTETNSVQNLASKDHQIIYNQALYYLGYWTDHFTDRRKEI